MAKRLPVLKYSFEKNSDFCKVLRLDVEDKRKLLKQMYLQMTNAGKSLDEKMFWKSFFCKIELQRKMTLCNLTSKFWHIQQM